MIQTSSPIYSNVSGDGPPTTSSFPKHKITHSHKSAAGENPNSLARDIRSSAVNSGSQMPLGPGAHEVAHVNAPARGPRLQPGTPRQITASRLDDQNRFAGRHEGYGVKPRPAPYLGGSKKR
jgi:hypothetical protein